MPQLCSIKILLTALPFALAIAASADINQTTTLASGNALNLDTGAIVNSGETSCGTGAPSRHKAKPRRTTWAI